MIDQNIQTGGLPYPSTEQPLALSAALNCPTNMVVDVYRFLERQGFLTSGKFHKLTEAGIAIGLNSCSE